MPTVTALNPSQIQEELKGLQGWELKEGAITKLYKFKDFKEAMNFVNRAADLAEEADHHPDILIRYNKVMLTLATHSAGGLTGKDFRLAREIDSTEVLHDQGGHRFYIPLESRHAPEGVSGAASTSGIHEALLLYRRQGETLDFYQTYVPEEHRNKGLAEKVVEAGFRYAQEQKLKVIPTCSYVSAFLHKRKEFLPLVKK